MSRAKLMELTKTAWIRTRFDAPWIAHRASRDPLLPNSWIQLYETASNPQRVIEVVRFWAKKTILWRDEIRSLAEWEEIIKNGYWKPSDNHFDVELHLGKVDTAGSYFIM